ncbi:MAG: hypothetical protein ACOY31_00420 [Bacillota bacterium]
MPHLIKILIVMPLFYFILGHKFSKLWRYGLAGVGIMLAADYTGFRLNFYHYQNGFITMGGWMPVPHIINVFIDSMFYVNWLPKQWGRRFWYTVCFSVVSLFVEAIVYSAGGIVYHNWKLWHSYFLSLGGLSLLAYISDFLSLKQSDTIS